MTEEKKEDWEKHFEEDLKAISKLLNTPFEELLDNYLKLLVIKVKD